MFVVTLEALLRRRAGLALAVLFPLLFVTCARPVWAGQPKVRLVTLSQSGILALDYKVGNSASVVAAVRRGKGVEYTIRFTGARASLYLTSSERGGKGALVGIPLSPTDAFALRFTLVDVRTGRAGPSRPRQRPTLSAGAVLNQERSGAAYRPVQLGGARGKKAVGIARTDATVTRTVGFTAYIAPRYRSTWPPSGGTVRLLVEPAPDAVVIGPEGRAPESEVGYTDRVAGRRMTLSQPDILALDYQSARSASIVDAVPFGGGIAYRIRFTGAPASIMLASSERGGKGALVGSPLSSNDTFALGFTLLSPAPGADASLSVGAVVNQLRSATAFAPVHLGGTADITAIAATGTDATAVKTVGFMAYIAPRYSSAWPAEGATVRLLVEPVIGAVALGPGAPASPGEIASRERAAGRTLTLSQSDILALDHRLASSASVVSAVPSGKGVEYTIQFTQAPARISVISTYAGGEGSLVGVPLTPGDTFALRFTLLSPTPGPEARLSAGAVVNRETFGVPGAFTHVRLGGTGELSATATMKTDATATRTLGFIAYIAPQDSGAWPASGATVRLLVEPVEEATVLPVRMPLR